MPPLEQPVMRTTVLAVSDMLPQMSLDGKVVLRVCLGEELYKYLEVARITSTRAREARVVWDPARAEL